MIWERIARSLEAIDGEGDVRIEPDGGRPALFPWPAAPGLFASREAEEARHQQVVDALRANMAHTAAAEREQAGQKPAKASRECAGEILRLLYKQQQRLTAEEMEGAFSKDADYYSWSGSAIAATAGWMRKQGMLDNRRDQRGVGFGLTNWELDPLAESPDES